jgi:PAS domain-containing protein
LRKQNTRKPKVLEVIIEKYHIFMDESLFTCFASAERSSQDEILRQYKIIVANEELVVVMNGVAPLVTVLNTNRQIVFVNKAILDMIGSTDIHQALGQRVGELFGCRHAFTVNGCGTSMYCSACGAVHTMLACTWEHTSVEECSLTNDETKITLDLRIHSTYINVFNETFILCSIFDISSEKRRGVMERIFFHDIMNTVNGINGVTTALNSANAEEQQMYFSYLRLLLNSMTDQIVSHQVLTMAEKDEYHPERRKLSTIDFLMEEVEKHKQHASIERKGIRIDTDSEEHTFVSDKTLLSRVLSNMIKNALEAEPNGAVIDVGVFKESDGYLYFWVRNKCVISEDDKLQIFNRSFSTKGSNRGLGTYSMKLLTEKYLNGTITYRSHQGEGTVFTVRMPV